MNLSSILKTIALCGFVTFFVSGCGNRSKSGEYGYKEIYSNATGITFDDFDIIELAKDVPMGSIHKIIIEDSLIFAATEDRVYSFNMDGTLNTVYGTQGRAANEYLYLNTFYVDTKAKQVCIIDASQDKFIYFGYDGTFIRKQEFNALNTKLRFLYDVCLLPDGKLFVHNRIYNDSGLLYAIIDLKDESITEFKSVPFSTANTAEFCGEHQCNMFDGQLYYIIPFDPNIYVLDGYETTVSRVIPGVENVPTEKDLQQITDYNFFKIYNMYNEGTFVGFSGLYETDSLIFLNQMENMNYYIIDKNTGAQRRYSYSYDEEELKTIPIRTIRAAYKDWLIGVVDASSITSMNEDFSGINSDPFLRKLHGFAGRITDESNPCLLFYKIKSIQ